MHSIRKYRNWAVLLLVVLAATAVVASTPNQSTFAPGRNPALAPSGTTSETQTNTGPIPAPRALSPARPPEHPRTDARNVAIMAADYDPNYCTLHDSLENYGENVTVFMCQNYTPTLAEMQAFDAIAVWTNYVPQNPATLGDNLADFVDGGGYVVLADWCNDPYWGIDGRITTETQYMPWKHDASNDFSTASTGWYDPSNPITADLGTPITSYYRSYINLQDGATLLASMENGEEFVALSPNQMVIGINVYPGQAEDGMWSGPYGKLFFNALEYVNGPPLDNDIALAKIKAPATVQDPGVPVAPLILIKNAGGLEQSSIPVTVRIWDPTPALVYDNTQTYGGPLAPGDTHTINTFPDWTPGTELAYACTAFCNLYGDEKPKNDTAKLTVATIGWKDIPPPSEDADRLAHGTAYDPVNDMLYMFGGCPEGQYGSNMTKMQRYDPVTMEWTTMTSMTAARDWIHGSYVNGKIYVIGGMNNSGTGIDVNECYDIATNSWSTKAACPRTVMFGFEVMYKNMIYMVGGASPQSKRVDIYDPASNSWSVGTDLPLQGGIGSAAVIGDTIYIMQAFDDAAWQCWANMYKGAINPSNPTQINWIQGQAMNPKLCVGSTVAIDDVVYTMGGFKEVYYGSSAKEMYRYQQSTGTVDNWAIVNYPEIIGKNNYMIVRQSGPLTEIYCLAGDLANNWSLPNNKYRVLKLPPKPYDLAVSKITVPASAQLVPGSTVVPACSVANYGTIDATQADVRLIITDASATELYNGTVQVDVPAQGVVEAVFPAFDFPIPDSLFIGRVFAFRTELPGDQRPFNDAQSIKTMTLTDTVYSYGGSAPEIDGYFDEAGGEWDGSYSFDCSNIFGWKGVPQGPGAAYAYFKNDNSYWYVGVRMPAAPLRDNGDKIGICMDENNDGAWAGGLNEGEYQIWVSGTGADEVQFRYHNPSGVIGQWGSVVGSQSASRTDNGYLVFEARIPIGTQPYKLQITPSCDTVGLYMYALDGAKNLGWFRAGLDNDDWNEPSLYGTLMFGSPQTGDIGVTKIIAPVNSYLPNTDVSPKATWKNNGETSMDFTAFMFLTDPFGTRVFSGSQSASLEHGLSVDLTFTPPYTLVDLGDWAVKCSTVAGGDDTPANDVLSGTFKVSEAPANPPGWAEVAQIPSTPSGKAVKDGGCLAYDAGSEALYAGKGYKTGDFYKFDLLTDGWGNKKDKPNGIEGKPPYKGQALVSDGNGKLYSTKGNNTLGWWEYDVELDSWNQKTDVPVGANGKKVKGGTGLAWAEKTEDGVGAVYVLKGYKNEFYKYTPSDSTWTTLPEAPIGSKIKWDKGSWLVSDGQHTLYAHKAKYHEFYSYDIDMDTWSSMLTAMPINGTAGSKKSKDGGAAAWFEDQVYAFKGGNTNEFWRYTPLGDSWREMDSIPKVGSTGKKKRVKAGGSLAALPGVGVFGLKGNKCLEFWRYVPYPPTMAQPSREGVMAGRFDIGNVSFAIAPNPLSGGFATVRYSLPRAGTATLHIYDVAGRTVLTQAMVAGRTGTASLDLRKLNAGVYLVKVATEGFSSTQKLVVQH